MADYEEKLKDEKFQNWVKASLGLCITREGLIDFVTNVVEEFHFETLKSLLSQDQIERRDICTICRKENILKCPTKDFCKLRGGECLTHHKEELKVRPCPNGICDSLRDAIIKNHMFHRPSWKNTNAERWFHNPWEVAKCFMPPDGYLRASSIEETDLNGILSVMSNLRTFERKISKKELDEMREIGRKVRHCADITLVSVNEYLDKMVRFLASCCSRSQESTEAVKKLKMLKLNDLKISTNDVNKVLQETVNGSQETVNESLTIHQQDLKERRDQYVQNIREALERGIASLIDIITARNEALQVIEKAKQHTIQNISSRQKRGSDDYDDYEQRKIDLKEDLVTFYQDVHQSVPVSPLIPENEASILDFYVQQKMEIIEWNRYPPCRKLINSYEEVFTEKSRNIYVVAKAGSGKTTFMKRICAIWCFSQQQEGKEPDSLSHTALEVLKRFDFLFLVLMADVQDECEVDNIIEDQIISSLSRSRQYNKDFLERLLHQERCLVLLDGLDEWSHPQGTLCHKFSPIPHRKSRQNWTILSTSRSWKVQQAKLSNFKIDKYIELIENDRENIRHLAKNVLSILDSVNKTEKQYLDFMKEVEEKGIKELIYTPILFIQLLCLWHDDRPLGNTKCQIYSNMIEFILLRGNEKVKHLSLPPVPHHHIGIETEAPVCVRQHLNFQYYFCHLIDVGKFAYYALTSAYKESTLLFERKMTEDCLSEEQLNFCLRIGLLSEARVSSNVSHQVSKFSFIHKTFQEFFCALYLSNLPSDKCAEKITAACRSVQTILAFYNVFVFLSGLRPLQFSFISKHLSAVIADDLLTVSFRRRIGTAREWGTCFKIMKGIQNMYLSCVRECREALNGIEIRLEDIFIDGDCQKESVSERMKILIGMNTQSIKSIKMYDCQVSGKIASYLEEYKLHHVKGLERLEIVGHLAENDLISLISRSADTLVSISLCKDLRKYGQRKETKVSTPVSSLSIIRSMQNLEALMLECFKLPHSQLEDLFACISERHTMQQIGLGFLYCSDHGESCNGVGINLSQHSSLQTLQLGEIPLSDVKINVDSLEKCRVGKMYPCTSSNAVILSEILNSLSGAERLQELMCFDFETSDEVSNITSTLPKFENLQSVAFKRIDFKDHLVRFPLNIKHIKLSDVQISAQAVKTLVDESESIPVTFELFECCIKPDDEYHVFKSEVIHSKNYTVWCDEILHDGVEDFVFTKETLD